MTSPGKKRKRQMRPMGSSTRGEGEGEEDLDAFLQGFVEKGQPTPSVDSLARRDEATSRGGAKASREADAEGNEEREGGGGGRRVLV
jgi:hypothetical protein